MARELPLHGVAELREGQPEDVAEVLRGVLKRATITAEADGYRLDLHLVAPEDGLRVSTQSKLGADSGTRTHKPFGTGT